MSIISSFYSNDLVSIQSFQREHFFSLFRAVDKLISLPSNERLALCKDKILATLFFQPSTRTRLSFESAMLWTGGSNITMVDPATSKAVVGESLEDTIRVVQGYADIIVLRHPNDNAAAIAADISIKPVINAGCGTLEHPTQALLDIFTIYKEHGAVDGLKIGLVGSLSHSRAANSLLLALNNFDVEIFLVSHPNLKVHPRIISALSEKKVHQTDNLSGVINKLDVLYFTRIHREDLPSSNEYKELRGQRWIDQYKLSDVKKNLIIMHSLPRDDEINLNVDQTQYAVYFRQAHNGKLIRAASLSLILNQTASTMLLSNSNLGRKEL